MPHGSIRRQPASSPCLFLETSKYKVHKLWLVTCVQGLMKLEFNNVQELESIDLSEGVQTTYLSSQYEIIHLPIPQRMYQNKSYQE